MRLVLAIARRGGLGSASRELHLTQSALSHHLKALEERLGVTVFDRVGRGLVLNAHGTRLVDLAERLLPAVLETERALTTPQMPPRRLRITTGCYTAYPWLPEALHQLAEAMPDTRVVIVVDATRRAAEALLADEVDVALMPWTVDDKRLVPRPVFDDDICAVMHPSDPLAKRATVPVALLAPRRVLTHEMPPHTLAWAKAALGRSFVHLRNVERLQLTEAMVAVTKSGDAISLMGTWPIKSELASGVLVARPLRPRMRRPFALVTLRSKATDPRVALLANLLRRWGRESAATGLLSPVRSRLA